MFKSFVASCLMLVMSHRVISDVSSYDKATNPGFRAMKAFYKVNTDPLTFK